VFLNSLGGDVLEKSLQVLGPGGKLISISGPPDPDFAKELGSPWILRQVMRLLSYRIRKKAKRYGVSYSFLFMKASGDQLREIGRLIDSRLFGPLWIGSSHSNRLTKPWLTLKADGQKARWSSR